MSSKQKRRSVSDTLFAVHKRKSCSITVSVSRDRLRYTNWFFWMTNQRLDEQIRK